MRHHCCNCSAAALQACACIGRHLRHEIEPSSVKLCLSKGLHDGNSLLQLCHAAVTVLHVMHGRYACCGIFNAENQAAHGGECLGHMTNKCASSKGLPA